MVRFTSYNQLNLSTMPHGARVAGRFAAGERTDAAVATVADDPISHGSRIRYGETWRPSTWRLSVAPMGNIGEERKRIEVLPTTEPGRPEQHPPVPAAEPRPPVREPEPAK